MEIPLFQRLAVTRAQEIPFKWVHFLTPFNRFLIP